MHGKVLFPRHRRSVAADASTTNAAPRASTWTWVAFASLAIGSSATLLWFFGFVQRVTTFDQLGFSARMFPQEFRETVAFSTVNWTPAAITVVRYAVVILTLVYTVSLALPQLLKRLPRIPRLEVPDGRLQIFYAYALRPAWLALLQASVGKLLS